MWVYDIEVVPNDTPVKLEGVWGGRDAFVVHYNAETYPPTYTVVMADETINRSIPHNVIRLLPQ